MESRGECSLVRVCNLGVQCLKHQAGHVRRGAVMSLNVRAQHLHRQNKRGMQWSFVVLIAAGAYSESAEVLFSIKEIRRLLSRKARYDGPRIPRYRPETGLT